jgi:hypothetical protein
MDAIREAWGEKNVYIFLFEKAEGMGPLGSHTSWCEDNIKITLEVW